MIIIAVLSNSFQDAAKFFANSFQVEFDFLHLNIFIFLLKLTKLIRIFSPCMIILNTFGLNMLCYCLVRKKSV